MNKETAIQTAHVALDTALGARVMAPDAPRTYYIWTVGCQMNKADSDRLAGALEQIGLKVTETPQQADVIVLNSCVVRQSAEDKVTGTLTFMKPLKTSRPDRVLALMGCMVGPKTDELHAKFPYVDVFMRPQQYAPLLDIVGGKLGLDWEGCVGTLLPPRPQVSAYIPIIHGCDLFCTFCIIPYRRGRQVSKPVDEVVNEARLLAHRGVKEVTLLGQTVDAYGLDLEPKGDMADHLEALNDVDVIERIRFLTSHPNFMTPRIIETIARLPKACEHINLPIQAGDDEVLDRMRRGYKSDDYLRLVERIRATIPGVAMSTDIIVGFPGETEAQFERTLDVLREVRFDKVHVAAYSTRPGTLASRRMPDDIPAEEKDRRLKAVEALQEDVARANNAAYLGRTVEVLVDGRQRGRWQGRTRTDKLVFFDDAADRLGETVQVRIGKTAPWSLQGTLAE